MGDALRACGLCHRAHLDRADGGHGTTLASADTGIATARARSVTTVANMKQNLAFAFVYNALRLRGVGMRED